MQGVTGCPKEAIDVEEIEGRFWRYSARFNKVIANLCICVLDCFITGV